MFGKVFKDVKSENVHEELESNRVKLYQDIADDYGFMMEDNPDLIVLLENAK